MNQNIGKVISINVHGSPSNRLTYYTHSFIVSESCGLWWWRWCWPLTCPATSSRSKPWKASCNSLRGQYWIPLLSQGHLCWHLPQVFDKSLGVGMLTQKKKSCLGCYFYVIFTSCLALSSLLIKWSLSIRKHIPCTCLNLCEYSICINTAQGCPVRRWLVPGYSGLGVRVSLGKILNLKLVLKAESLVCECDFLLVYVWMCV